MSILKSTCDTTVICVGVLCRLERTVCVYTAQPHIYINHSNAAVIGCLVTMVTDINKQPSLEQQFEKFTKFVPNFSDYFVVIVVITCRY